MLVFHTMMTLPIGRMTLVWGLLLALAGGASAFAEAPKPGTCQIWRDEAGIPHARGADRLDAYRCLGYLHGLDRAFEMDYFRRVAQGRLSEVFGTRTIKSDFQMRLFGLPEHAKRIYEEMDATTRVVYDSYAEGAREGMSAAIKAGVYEFEDFDYHPEEWKPEHSVLILLLQSFDQTRRSFEEKLREARRATEFGEGVEQLFSFDGGEGSEPLPWLTTILKRGEYPVKAATPKKVPVPARQEQSAARADWDLQDVPTGSNNWVVAPKRSATGRAWFANDPHLLFKTPSFWHWAHVQDANGEKVDVIGAGVPGMPVIASGSNRRVSWGLTNAYLDVADVYEIPKSALKEGDTRTIRPVVWFRVWKGLKLPVFFKTFQLTREGWPILPIPPLRDDHVIAVRWAGFELTGADFRGFQGLMESRSARDADTALSQIGVPSWNLAFADTGGAIGYRAIGKIPRRLEAPVYGLTRLSSLDQAPRWDYLTAEEMPHVFNPARGFVVTANNRHWGIDSRVSPGRIQYSGMRAFRIEELLTAQPRLDFEAQRKIQCDYQAVDARFMLPPLLELASKWELTPRERAAIELLRAWDLQTGLDCRACGVFRFWMENLYGTSRHTVNSLYRVLTAPDAEEKLSSTARTGLRKALDGLGVKDSDPKFPVWGELHQADFPHISGEKRYDNRSIPTPGDDNTVSPGSGEFDGKRYRHIAGASQRLIVELTSPPRIRMVLPSLERDERTHELDREGSPWRRWRDCEYGEVKFPVDWTKVEASTVRARWGN